jgi:mannitol-specific phosphotransferase system IIBC component
MQKGSNVVIDWFFLLVTMIIDPTIVFAICVLMMVLSHRKKKGFVMLMFILINTFLAAVLKAYDSDPRPIWTEQSIRNIGFYCPV